MKLIKSYIKRFLVSTEGTSTPPIIIGIFLIIGILVGVVLTILKICNVY